MDQVEQAFNGRYREVNRETQQWYTYNHPITEPRPGAVSAFLLPSAGKPCRHTLYLSALCTTSHQLHQDCSFFPSVAAGRGVTPLRFLNMILINNCRFHFLAYRTQITEMAC